MRFDKWIRSWPAGFVADMRYAIRGIRRRPAFGLTVVITLAIGIGVNAAVFAITSAFLFRGFPEVDDNDGIVYISSVGAYCCVSYPDFSDWRAQSSSFTGMEVVHGFPVTFTDDRGFPESFDATEVSAGTFGLIGQAPLIGRDFVAADDAPGAARVAILSYGFWEGRYGRDSGVLGETIRIDGEPVTIIGVMPPGFEFPQKQELWLNLVPTSEVMRRDNRNLWFAFARLRDGATLDAARAEIGTIGARLEAEYPDTNLNRSPEVLSFNEFFVGSNENTLYASMWGAVAFVLLIACANLANLMLARAIGRSREVAVRFALGARRRRIIRQLLTEAVLLSLAGGAAGWILAGWIVRLYALAARGPGAVPWRVLDYTMDAQIVLYVAFVSICTGLLFGLAPARKLAALDVHAALKDGGRGATQGRRTRHLPNLLVASQVALAVVLLAGAGVMIRSFLNVTGADTGIVTDRTLTASLNLPTSSYASGAERVAFFDELHARLTATSGIESVAFANILPTWGSIRLPYELDDNEVLDESMLPRVPTVVISPNYFRTLGATVLSGRPFSDVDDVDSPRVAIVNERFAAQHWPGERSTGKRLRIFAGSEPAWYTVVGVASNIVQNDPMRQRVDATVYVPYAQRPRAEMWVIARTALEPNTLGVIFRETIQELDADLPIRAGPMTLSARLSERYWDQQLYAGVFLAFAVIALLLASVGLYAVVAHAVGQHRQEIGVRIAIGATANDILGLVMRIGLLPMGIGLSIGLVLSSVLTRVLQAELVQVSPTDPLVYVLTCVVLSLAAGLGCLIPARRAMRVDPVIALRSE
jgi:putative ABC transport system permease protein